jgi:hypothetical protein
MGESTLKIPNPPGWATPSASGRMIHLVVETIGLNDRGWLDAVGHTHSDALRVTERFHRRDFGHLDVQLTLDDPKTFTQPVTVKFTELLLPDTDLIESFCTENEKDLTHAGLK